MNDVNPYESTDRDPTPVSPSILFLSIGVVFGCALVCGLIGIGVGMALGTFAPGYYEALFSGRSAQPVNPVSIGIAMGLTQGIVFGAILGIVLVALFYWYRTRVDQIKRS